MIRSVPSQQTPRRTLSVARPPAQRRRLLVAGGLSRLRQWRNQCAAGELEVVRPRLAVAHLHRYCRASKQAPVLPVAHSRTPKAVNDGPFRTPGARTPAAAAVDQVLASSAAGLRQSASVEAITPTSPCSPRPLLELPSQILQELPGPEASRLMLVFTGRTPGSAWVVTVSGSDSVPSSDARSCCLPPRAFHRLGVVAAVTRAIGSVGDGGRLATPRFDWPGSRAPVIVPEEALGRSCHRRFSHDHDQGRAGNCRVPSGRGEGSETRSRPARYATSNRGPGGQCASRIDRQRNRPGVESRLLWPGVRRKATAGSTGMSRVLKTERAATPRTCQHRPPPACQWVGEQS